MTDTSFASHARYNDVSPIPVDAWSAAARMMGLWVRIPPVAWTFVVSVVCCQVEVSETSRSLVQRSPTDRNVSLCVI